MNTLICDEAIQDRSRKIRFSAFCCYDGTVAVARL